MNVVLDLSLSEPVFSHGYVYADLAVPVKADPDGREFVKNLDIIAVDKGLRNIFDWIPGERILNPLFGNLLLKYVSELISDVNSKNIAGAIQTMFSWEPRAKLVDVVVTPVPEDNLYTVFVKYNVPTLEKEVSTKFTINAVLGT